MLTDFEDHSCNLQVSGQNVFVWSYFSNIIKWTSVAVCSNYFIYGGGAHQIFSLFGNTDYNTQEVFFLFC